MWSIDAKGTGAFKLKSDHFGIEIEDKAIAEDYANLLKSDHFLIEMYHQNLISMIVVKVKIRPFWD